MIKGFRGQNRLFYRLKKTKKQIINVSSTSSYKQIGYKIFKSHLLVKISESHIFIRGCEKKWDKIIYYFRGKTMRSNGDYLVQYQSMSWTKRISTFLWAWVLLRPKIWPNSSLTNFIQLITQGLGPNGNTSCPLRGWYLREKDGSSSPFSNFRYLVSKRATSSSRSMNEFDITLSNS